MHELRQLFRNTSAYAREHHLEGQGERRVQECSSLTLRFMYCRAWRLDCTFTPLALAASSSTCLPCVVSKPCTQKVQ